MTEPRVIEPRVIEPRVIERYLQIRSATVAGHLPSGELGYLADVTGLLQLWRVAPDGIHEQLTFGSERITAALASPSEARWVVARDAGGNERHALFALEAGGGCERPLTDDPESIHVPGAFSPDGTRVAFGYFDTNESLNHIALATLSGGVPRRFTFAHGNQYSPVWSPDGARLAFSDDEAGVDTLSSKPFAGTSNERPLIPPPPSSTYAQSWSPDGAHILYRVQDAKNGFDIRALSLLDGKSELYVSGPADQSQGQFSPDGRWVAYTSTESGRHEVYVQPFPATGAKWQVSVSGGEQPRWRRDGKELFYLAPDRSLMALPIAAMGAFDDAAPQRLFATNIPFGDINVSQSYDVSADGERFVVAAADPLSPQTPISVIAGR